jgi:hypothetical protein
MTNIGNGLLIDYDNIYIAQLKHSNESKTGYRILYNDGDIAALLDINKVNIWYIKEKTLEKRS